jgi:indolepyruvate ferredoxin oxidoreductase beta subunit
MKSDIILAGVGGQGILSIASVIGMAALENDLHLKQAEVHGMSQRGGAVQSHLRISDKELASDLIPMGQADLILSVEPMESLRYIPWLASTGWLVTNTANFINIENYPDQQKILSEIRRIPNHFYLDADEIAKEIGSPRSSNIVMLGAACQFIPISDSNFHEGIRKIFEKKGNDFVKMNIIAFEAGRNACDNYLKKGNNY